MLFQRMIADDKIGLNYDYMGYAEFEFGATKAARIQLAKAMFKKDIDGMYTQFKVYMHKNKVEDFKVFIIGKKEFISTRKTCRE